VPKLTKRLIDSLEYDPDGPTNQMVYDDELPGFGVRILATGTKSFFLRYRTRTGRDRRTTLGKYGPMTLHEARTRARKERLSVYDGADPAEDRVSARQGKTLGEFAKIYINRHAKPNQKTWKATESRLKKHAVPMLGARKLEEIRRSDVAALHAKIGEGSGKYEANRVLATLSHLFNAAIEWGFLDETAVNPAARVKKYREKSRDRWVKPDELPVLVEAIEGEESLYTRALFKLFLLTGCRRAELCGLRWSDVDLSRRELRLEDTKAGRTHVLPLSEPAVEILASLPHELDNPFVFPGGKPGTALKPNGATQQWIRIRTRFWLLLHPERAAEFRKVAEADIAGRSKHAARDGDAVEARMIALARAELKGSDNLRLHDLRRTVGSWLAEGGASLPLIGRVLNHTNASTTQVYARLSDNPAREALERHGRKIIPIDEKRRSA